MPSLLAIYTCPVADVLRQRNEAASQLGLELNRTLVEDGEHWDALLDGEKISLIVRTLSEWDLMPGCGGSERAACGTVFVVRILEVAPNPTREPEPWREVSIRTARILERLTCSDVILGRWYSTRSLALVCPGLAKNDRAPLLKTIRDKLTNGFGDTIFCARGRIDTASWPADGDTQSTIWDCLQDLERRAEGTPFGTPVAPTNRSSARLLCSSDPDQHS